MFESFSFAKHMIWSWSVRSAIIVVMLSGSPDVRAQELPPASVLQNPSSGSNIAKFFSSKTPYEFWLTCLIGALGLAIIGVLIFGLRRIGSVKPEEITRPVIVLTVIVGTLILVTAGYSNEQIAPAFGLFGTIVGYMLGRLSQPSPAPTQTEERKGT
ncbi:hypothetical protein IVA79_01365 [Bradyrhizobium sp. 138]|uniref:hypothetical protein n=1 Tax=Bradyrhizobium sp. 138 TaxID=2782615 RepID=UPI001FF71852|nr:hypothetical protein [Bradyrhizobium sp. 138]MCK1732630.1 hypothetical protein [Bradyrhizobium sp. 138]